jgi:hypothetical protein
VHTTTPNYLLKWGLANYPHSSPVGLRTMILLISTSQSSWDYSVNYQCLAYFMILESLLKLWVRIEFTLHNFWLSARKLPSNITLSPPVPPLFYHNESLSLFLHIKPFSLVLLTQEFPPAKVKILLL